MSVSRVGPKAGAERRTGMPCRLPHRAPGPLVVVGMVGLDPRQTHGCQFLDQGKGGCDSSPGRQRVGQDRDSAGSPHQCNGAGGIGGVVAHVVGTVVGEPAQECLVPIGDHARCDKRIRDVRSPRRRARGDLRRHLLLRDRYAVRRQQIDHPLQPSGARGTGPVELGQQCGVGRVEEVAQQVHRPSVALAGDLHARHHGHAQPTASLEGFVPPGHDVVVGEPDDIQTRGERRDDVRVHAEVGEGRLRCGRGRSVGAGPFGRHCGLVGSVDGHG